MTTLSDARVDSGDDADPIALINAAVAAIRLAASHVSDAALPSAHDELRRTVLEARDRGVSWQTIGDTLGIARGSAYQRFRRRPGTAEDEQPLGRLNSRTGLTIY